jgi:hypothetical protein
MENTDRPAYPTNARMNSEMNGLTKREMFAMAAMQGMLSNPQYTHELKSMFNQNIITDTNAMLVRESIDMADELLRLLEA